MQINATFSVDGRLYLLKPAWLDAVSEFLHGRLNVADFDAILALLVECSERIFRRCSVATTVTKKVSKRNMHSA